MNTNNRARQLLHGVTLSAAMLFATTSLALADTPGYLFRDFQPTSSAAAALQARNAANDNRHSITPQQAKMDRAGAQHVTKPASR